MYTSAKTHSDRIIAGLISLLFAISILLFLAFYKIVREQTLQSEKITELTTISLAGFSDDMELLPDPGSVKSTVNKTTPGHATGKEDFIPSENALFSNYRNSNPLKATFMAPTSEKEPGVTGNPFAGREPGVPSCISSTGAVQLAGRKVLSLTKPIDTKEEGIVVVNITVAKNGQVIKAEANGRGTTTFSAVLKLKACEAAFSSLFSASGSEEEQRGTITYVFEF
ncbi:MAG: energy transducer TonB [Bacteroidetes bacterium]|jgi:hypothetical protein|nr:energy transducer TonB [Bacteroidota bacterium]